MLRGVWLRSCSQIASVKYCSRDQPIEQARSEVIIAVQIQNVIANGHCLQSRHTHAPDVYVSIDPASMRGAAASVRACAAQHAYRTGSTHAQPGTALVCLAEHQGGIEGTVCHGARRRCE